MSSIPYTVKRSTRRTVAIRVLPEGAVAIAAPLSVSDREIARIVATKRNWIDRKLKELANSDYPYVIHRFEQGERFLYLGNPYVLHYAVGRGKVSMDNGILTAHIPPGLTDADERRAYARELLRAFYTARAKALLREKTACLADRYGFKPLFVSVKDYTSRWGCCFGDGRVYFNWRIIMAPEEIIDYVIVHELCHLQVANHSPAFWSLVDSLLPQWRRQRQWLRRNGHTLTF